MTNVRSKFMTNILKIPIMINHTLFDAPALLLSIPSEISILSYSKIFITHINIHVNKLVDNIYHLFKNNYHVKNV